MALGRGLNALITSTGKSASDSGSSSEPKIWYIPITKVFANPKQPRRKFLPADLDELASSIKEHGVLQPIIVTENEDGGYEIVAGERRWRASRLAGIPTIPAIVRSFPEKEKLEVALVENVQRANLDPIEEAFAYRRLVEEFNLTQQEVADKVGKNRSTVANIIRLLNLPDEAQVALSEGKISTGQAVALLSLPDKETQLATLSSLLGQKMTVRELERQTAKTAGHNTRRDPNLTYLEDQIRSALGTKVTISKKGEKGTVQLAFYSNDELKELIKKITGGEK